MMFLSATARKITNTKEENTHDNLNHTIYCDQINKVSLAVMDIIESMKVIETKTKGIVKENQVKKSTNKNELLIGEPSRKH